MAILRAHGVLTLGAAAALAGAMASGSAGCGSSSSGGGASSSSSGSSSGMGEDSGSSSGTGSSSGSSGGGDGGGAPSIVINSPMDMAMVTPNGSKAAVPIAFTVSNFMLVAPMSSGCSNTGNCGHVHINVDGTACNTSGAPYNNAATASPTGADLSLCPMVAGAHTIVLELRHNDHSAFNPAITATVHVTATAASDAGSD